MFCDFIANTYIETHFRFTPQRICMPATVVPYPITPTNVNSQILQPSPEFKQEALKVLASILFFIATYFLLVAAALGLAALSVAGGIWIVLLKPTFLTLVLGLGLAGLGVMVVFFLVKFLFKRHKVDRSGLIEVKEQEHPQLFDFVRTLARETQTSFPKKICLSPEVNASVFYDSSFWSMFLPVRKNLQIGLGLVNAVNLSEFKAIVAHEFGHFSQRSMKFGSYVYHVNHIIFNMLHDNDSYERVIERWASVNGYFAFFASLTVRIVRGIQWVLKQVYEVVNKVYMSLSMQMEFHADTVAASVSGGNHLITSLRRLEIADSTYNNVFSFYQENFKKGFKPENVYPQHREVMRLFAIKHGLQHEHGLPQLDSDTIARFNKTRVIVKDQWASHPSTDDREKHLQSLHIITPAQTEPAWALFEHPEELQRKVTEKIFEQVKYDSAVRLIDAQAFGAQFQESIQRYELPALYKGFFDGRAITKVDLRRIEDRTSSGSESLDTLLTEEVLALPFHKNGLMRDIETLNTIVRGDVNAKSFEFSGEKYKAGDARMLQTKLEDELRETERLIAEADENLIAWFIRNVDHQSREQLRQRYSELFMMTEEMERQIEVHHKMQQCLFPLYQTMLVADIEKAVAALKLQEAEFKQLLERTLYDPKNNTFISDDQRSVAMEYLSKDEVCFRDNGYDQPALERLNESLYLLYHVASEKVFQAKASVLAMQLELVKIA